MKLKTILFAVVTLLITSCKVTSQTNRELYEQSMINSIRPDSSKISYDLVQINDSNTNLIRKTINNQEYILVCTWKQNISFYQKETEEFLSIISPEEWGNKYNYIGKFQFLSDGRWIEV